MQSETTSLLPTAIASPSSNAIRLSLKEMAGGDGKLQKSEFKVVLLRLNIRIKQAVVDSIFEECDTDHDGALTIDEILDYVDSLKPHKTTMKDAVIYTMNQAASSVVWWFALAFHFAAWVGIVSFLYKEAGNQLRPEWSIVGAWFFFFGAVYFFKLLRDNETSLYDTLVQAKILLKTSVDQDPTFFDQKAGEDVSMDPYELNLALQEQGLYVPRAILEKIFADIDTDHSGTITKDEMRSFAKSEITDSTKHERQRAIHEAMIHHWGFWSLICWFIGSVLFLVGAHLNYAGYMEPPLPKNTYLHLYGLGSVMYFLLAVCMIPMIQGDVKDYLECIEQMGKAFAQRRKRMGFTTDAQSFRSLNVDSDRDLDVMDLYEVLIQEGVLIPYDTLLELFDSADKSGDGLLQVEEFTGFIASLHVAKDPWEHRLQMLKRAPSTSSFFGWSMFFVGGIFFTMGSYFDVANSTYWYFAGAICYGAASGKNVFGTLKNHYLHFWAVEAGKADFKARIAGGSFSKIV